MLAKTRRSWVGPRLRKRRVFSPSLASPKTACLIFCRISPELGWSQTTLPCSRAAVVWGPTTPVALLRLGKVPSKLAGTPSAEVDSGSPARKWEEGRNLSGALNRCP